MRTTRPITLGATLCVLLIGSRAAFADVRVQFVPASGTAPLIGGQWSSLAFPGTVAAVTGTFTGADTTVAPSGTVTVNVTGGTIAGTNTQAQFTRTRGTPAVSGSGGFTEGPLYQSFGGFAASGSNSLWLTVTGAQPSTWFLVELYAYDNSFSGRTTFTDSTAGSADTSGTVNYSAGATFTTNSAADNQCSVILAVESDTTGRIVVQASGLNNGNPYAVVNGFRISSKWIPKVYVPTLSGTQPVVGSVTPQQFGAKGDGVTDDTAAFQNAINFVYHTGIRAGGVVYIPKATYAFYGNLSLPVGVTLQGDWTNWTTGTNGVMGTTFAIYTTGTASTPGFLNVAGNDAVIGINFWYPNQNPSNITSYPYTMNCASACTLQDLVLINSYQGIYIYGCEYSFRGIYGSPLATGIQVDGGADWASMEDINFTPADWVASGLPNAPSSATGPQAAWMQNNGTGLLLQRIDGLNCMQVNINGYYVGVNCSQSTAGSTPGVPMPSFYSGTIQNCTTGIMANYTPGQQGIQCTNLNISGGTAIVHSAASVGFYIHLENCVLAGTSGTSVYINSAGANDWNDFFQAQDCTFNGAINPNSGVTDLVDCTINSGTQCIMGANVCKAAFAGCTFSPSQNIVNESASSALLISSSGATLLDSSTNARIINPGISWSAFFNAYQACQPAKQDLFVATDYGALGNGTNDDTTAVQSALSAAAANGGGIVYLPGGHYKTSGSLTVAAGVELRGVFEVRHQTGSWPDGYCKASVIQPTAGAGGTSGPPAVILAGTSGIRGVDFSYEAQTPVAVIPYPPTIQGQGANVYAIGCDLPNTYIGIDFDTYSCPNHYISMIYGVALSNFIKIGNASSGCVEDTEAQTSYWDQLSDTVSPVSATNGSLINTLEAYTLANATVHWWGNCNELVAINPSINDNIAVHCVSENGAGPTVEGIVQTNDASNYGFYLEASGSSSISLANSWMVIIGGAAFLSTPAYQGTFRLFNASPINYSPVDFSIAGGNIGLQVIYHQLFGPLGAQVTGGGLNLINQCLYLIPNVPGVAFPAYPLNFSGPGVAGNPSRAVGTFNQNGFAITNSPGSLASEWQNFSRYTKPAFPYVTQAGLVATGSMDVPFDFLIPASENPGSYSTTTLPAGLTVNGTTGLISGTPTMAGSSTVILTASNASGSGTSGLIISILPPAPSVTGSLSATGTQWNGFSYQIQGSNNPTSYGAAGLPAGLSLDASNGVISGVPSVVGTSSVLISAANAGGTSLSATLSLIIQPPPLTITSTLNATGTDRSAFNYDITANNNPTGYSVLSLPAGLTIAPGTGVISGSPTVTGTFSVVISAFNASGTDSATITFIVDLASPLITSPSSVSGANDVPFSYQIQATDSPTSYSGTGFPAGLSLSASSGLISGTPAATGTFTATIAASNAVGSGSAILVIALLPPPPPVPTGLTAISGSSQVPLSWNSSTGAAGYDLERSLTAGTGFANLVNLTGTSYVDTSVTNGTLYYYAVTSVNSSGVQSATSNNVGVMPGSLPSPWQWQDIATSSTGGANYSGTTFSIAASGGDIYGTSDSFGFVYQPITGGTCRIIAKVLTNQDTNQYAKAGVMVRNTLAANSAYVDMVLWPPGGEAQFQSRSVAGQSAAGDASTGGISPPYWVKLIQTGTSFTSFISSSGTSWTEVGAVGVTMGSTEYVGLPVSSDNKGEINLATFNNVSVSGTLPPAPQLSNYQNPVVVAFGNNLSYQITASNSPEYYTAAVLPAGLGVNASTGLITGVPGAVGTTVLAIGAGNDGGTSAQSLTISVVSQPPSITNNVLSATSGSGSAFTYQISATNTPTSYAGSGLPSGVTVSSSTGLISGIPLAAGTFNATITATNPVGSGTANLLVWIQTPLQEWQSSVFGANASNPAVSGNLVVNNSANITNLMAYALGFNPFTVQAANLPTFTLNQSNGNLYPALQFQRNTTAADISYVVQASSSPGVSGTWTPISTFTNGSWSPAGNVTETGSAPQVNVEVSGTSPITSGSAGFIRLELIH